MIYLQRILSKDPLKDIRCALTIPLVAIVYTVQVAIRPELIRPERSLERRQVPSGIHLHESLPFQRTALHARGPEPP